MTPIAVAIFWVAESACESGLASDILEFILLLMIFVFVNFKGYRPPAETLALEGNV